MARAGSPARKLIFVLYSEQVTWLIPLLLPTWLNPEHIIQSWGLPAVAFVIFIECAIFPILPGDSLLFAVGLFAAAGTIHYGGSTLSTILIVFSVLLVCAVGGNVAGYWVGRLVGPPLFKERTGFWGKVFNPKYIDKTHHFFERYGARALILARFVPLVRTFVTWVAGVGKMTFRHFIAYTAIGGIAWVLIVTTAGWFLGGIPIIKNNFELAAVIIVLISILPMVWEWYKSRRAKKVAAAQSPAE